MYCNRTEWSPIRSVIIRVINKIGRPSIITDLILLPGKFLQFDWLRADVKITVAMVTPNHQSRRTSYAKMVQRFLDFEIRRFKN